MEFNAIRMGRSGNRARLLKVFFNGEKVASDCLKGRKLLTKTNFYLKAERGKESKCAIY